MTLADRVKARREALELSQEELARRMGYKSRTSINKIEMGRPVSQKIIVRLAEVLGTTPSYLMGWEEMQKKNDTLSDIVLRLRSDEDFFSVVEKLYEMDSDKLSSLLSLLK